MRGDRPHRAEGEHEAGAERRAAILANLAGRPARGEPERGRPDEREREVAEALYRAAGDSRPTAQGQVGIGAFLDEELDDLDAMGRDQYRDAWAWTRSTLERAIQEAAFDEEVDHLAAVAR